MKTIAFLLLTTASAMTAASTLKCTVIDGLKPFQQVEVQLGDVSTNEPLVQDYPILKIGAGTLTASFNTFTRRILLIVVSPDRYGISVSGDGTYEHTGLGAIYPGEKEKSFSVGCRVESKNTIEKESL